jgi:TRAP-type C4-dicarboxylate transport system permease small subunit
LRDRFGSRDVLELDMQRSAREHVLAFLDRLQAAQLRLAASALILMMLITAADVFMRYVFNSPVRGSYDLVECLLVVFVFHGMAGAFLKRQNIVIDVIDHFAPPRAISMLIRIADVLSVVCLVLIAWAMLRPAMQAYDYGDRKLMLNLPLYLLWIVALVGMAGTILCALGALIRPPRSEDEPR